MAYSTFGTNERTGWSDEDILEGYLKYFTPVTDRIAETLVDRCQPSAQACLDLCCGQGNLTALLVEAGGDVSGLDFSARMLELAAQRAPTARLVESDAADMPFEDNVFDHVFCSFGMMHLPDQPAALREIARVLMPGGRFTMATWEAPSRSPAFGTVFGAIRATADMSVAPAQPDLFAFTEPETAKAMLAEAGLKVIAHDICLENWVFENPEDLWNTFLYGTVGAGMLIRSQSAEVQEAIAKQITQSVAEKFADDGVYRVPVPVVVVSAEASLASS